MRWEPAPNSTTRRSTDPPAEGLVFGDEHADQPPQLRLRLAGARGGNETVDIQIELRRTRAVFRLQHFLVVGRHRVVRTEEQLLVQLFSGTHAGVDDLDVSSNLET